MNILFITEARQDQIRFYIDMLEGLNNFENVQFDTNQTCFEKYDVILLMYSDCKKYLEKIRKMAPLCKIGIVDPRVAEGSILKGDFIVAQGIEEENWFSDYYFDIFRYDFHPINQCTLKKHCDNNKIILGTHGNKIHLHTMYPYLSRAIEALGQDFDVEFRAYYNIKEYGQVDFDLFPSGNVVFKEIQWSWDIYQNSLPEVDIGVVPNLIPIKDLNKAKRTIECYPAFFNEHLTDNLVRYKGTSNIGRLYPFAQLGIPVVADLYPSSCNAIEPGVTGFFGGSTGMWYRALYKLASSAELRQSIGWKMQERYLATATPNIFNEKFLEFLLNICSRSPTPIPCDFIETSERLNDHTFIKKYSQISRKNVISNHLSVIPSAIKKIFFPMKK